eukprot:gene16737-19881_t
MDTTEVYISWESTVYPDGGIFEGEYKEGLMDGLGVYRWSNGSIFKGQWKENNMHGCGQKFYPAGAMEEGEWIDDDFVGDYAACSPEEALATAKEAEIISDQAKMFMNKPDGEVTAKLEDGKAFVNQNPVVYAAGTEYLAPGPIGNAFAVPQTMVEKLLATAKLHKSIYDAWNFQIPSQAELEEEEKTKEKKRSDLASKAAAEYARKQKEAQAQFDAIVDEEDDEEEEDEDDDDDDEQDSGK